MIVVPYVTDSAFPETQNEYVCWMRFIPTEYIMTMESRLIGIEAKDIRASFQSAQNIAT